MCAPTKWSALPVAVESARVASFDAAHALVVGDDAAGLTHVFRLTSTSATDVPTKVPHTKARMAISPLHTIVLVGGAAEIESFTP
jgi:hypothetical protein